MGRATTPTASGRKRGEVREVHDERRRVSRSAVESRDGRRVPAREPGGAICLDDKELGRFGLSVIGLSKEKSNAVRHWRSRRLHGHADRRRMSERPAPDVEQTRRVRIGERITGRPDLIAAFAAGILTPAARGLGRAKGMARTAGGFPGGPGQGLAPTAATPGG
jgi:hypothetical protein